MLSRNDSCIEVWSGIGAGIIALLVGWGYAIADHGWLLGLAFGWISPSIIGVIAGLAAFTALYGLRCLYLRHTRMHQ